MNEKLRIWWRVWRLPVLAAVGLLAAWMLRQPVLKLAAGWRADHAAANAQAHAAAGEWEAAEREASHALRLERSRIDALRVLLESSVRGQSKDTLRIAATVFTHPDSTVEDKARTLELLLLARDDLGFRRLQGLLTPEQLAAPDIVLQTTRYLSVRGDSARALERIRNDVAATGNKDPRFTLLEAEILLRMGRHRDAQEIIAGLLPREGGIGITAFRMLRQLSPVQIEADRFPFYERWLESRIEAGEAVTVEDRLLLASLRLHHARFTAKENPAAAAAAVIERTIAEFREENLDALAGWLQRMGRGQRVLELIDEERGRQSPVLYDLRLRALIAAQDWEGADQWLSHSTSEAAGAEMRVLHAIVAKRLGKRGPALSHWMEAMRLAQIRDDGNFYLRLSRIAMEFGEWEWAVKALLEASRYPESMLPPATDLTSLIDHLLREDALTTAIELSRFWLAREPENPSLRNNFLYLHLLAGDPPESTVAQTESLVRAFPGMIGYHSTHALALAWDGRLQEAAAAISSPKLDWSRATASDQAIRRAVVEASRAGGFGREADFSWLESAPLYPAELRLLRNGPKPAPKTTAPSAKGSNALSAGTGPSAAPARGPGVEAHPTGR